MKNKEKEIFKKDKKDMLDYLDKHINKHRLTDEYFLELIKPIITIILLMSIQNTTNSKILNKIIHKIFAPYIEIAKDRNKKTYKDLIKFINDIIYKNYNPTEILLNISSKNSSAKIPQHFLSSNEDIEDTYLTLPSSLTPFEREIYHAIITLFHYDYQIFTPQLVLDLLSGKIISSKNTSTKIGARFRKEIDTTIEKLKNTKVKFKFFTQKIDENKIRQYQLEHYNEPQKWSLPELIYRYIILLKGNERHDDIGEYIFLKAIYQSDNTIYYSLLPCGAIENKKVDNKTFSICYSFIDTPPLYDEFKRKYNFIQLDTNLLNIPNLSNTEENIIIKCYLLRIISDKKRNLKQLTIHFSDIYKYLGNEEPNVNMSNQKINAIRVKLFDTRKKIKQILSYWHEKNLFLNYTINTKTINITF